jgi:hypothetical protein
MLVSQAEMHSDSAMSPEVSVLVEGGDDQSTGASVECRHHLYADAVGVHVFDGDDGLVQSTGGQLAVVEHAGREFLSGDAGGVADARLPGNLQHGPGVQFTATAWTSRLERSGVQVSMDGVGRCHDNIFVERLWRSVKYEDLYPKRYATVAELEAGLTEYFKWYNEERPHQSLKYRTPASVHAGK